MSAVWRAPGQLNMRLPDLHIYLCSEVLHGECSLMPRLRREALCCIPGSAGRDSKGGSWV